ncbi:MAG: hypothetical protein LBK12_00905 [Odoribacteraceae bacterium]|jgi:hypothetical protein|nr:hypothetical protein [Odoribacteraceae bacterium]
MRRLLPAFFLLALLACNGDGEKAPADALSGRGTLSFAAPGAFGDRPVVLHYFIPAGDPSGMPLLFLFPGIERNADDYLDAWIPAASAARHAVFAFEFPAARYTNNEYITGNVMDADGRLNPRERWTFSIVDAAFEHVRSLTGASATHFNMFGHSAGAQFVHRYLLFNPLAPVDKAVAANAGWYTMPDLSVDFPHGLKGTPVTPDDLRKAFGRNLTIHLGTGDTRQDGSLNTSPGAMKQGPHRYARGLYFYTNSRDLAALAGAPFLWQKRELVGVGHDHARMAADAAAIFFSTAVE